MAITTVLPDAVATFAQANEFGAGGRRLTGAGHFPSRYAVFLSDFSEIDDRSRPLDSVTKEPAGHFRTLVIRRRAPDNVVPA